MEKVNQDIIVSIRCITYNHAAFIRQCLDGFIMQQTNFRFEAIVHDDASTDGTEEIVREYAQKYPDIIKPMYETENQYSKGNGILRQKVNSQLRGKYIAICEGDDYWTDPYKLQKQVDFLESHPEYSMCSHRYLEYDQENSTMKDGLHPYQDIIKETSYDLNTYVKGAWYAQMLTVMYRRSALDLSNLYKYKMSYDVILFYQLLKKGKGCVLPDVMAVYRLHNGGVWSGLKAERQYVLNIKVRLNIYEIEQSVEAMDFLYNTMMDWDLGRKFMLDNLSLMRRVFYVIYKNKGFLSTFRLLKKRLLLV